MLLCLYLYALAFSVKALKAVNFILLLIILWANLRFFLVDNIGFLHSFQEAMKVSYFFIACAVLSQFKTLTEKSANGIFIVFTVTLIINITLSLAGIGLSTYGSFGAKGFFYGGNALSGVIVIISSLFLAKTIKHSMLRFFLCFLFLLLLSLLIGTKSSILGVILVAIAVILLNLNVKTFVTVSILTAALCLILFNIYELVIENPIYERMVHFYEQGGISRLLFSGRDNKFFQIIPSFLDKNILQLLFGYHYDELHALKSTLTEFDFADMFILFGTAFTILCFLGYSAIFFKIAAGEKNVLSHAAIISFIVLLCIAFIAGHVLFNGIVTPLWGLICGAALAQRNRKSL